STGDRAGYFGFNVRARTTRKSVAPETFKTSHRVRAADIFRAHEPAGSLKVRVAYDRIFLLRDQFLRRSMVLRGAILVVDDDHSVRTSLRRALETAHFQVLTASNGHEALRVLRSGASVRVVLLDAVMPEMNGLELLEHKQ